ncbi:MAG: mannitol-1-phosphate 5-dehydrogenase, partial [Clostridia bacterium]|nr:mannitol-1-phosphate 5-dehydrogenase [Clostridia bacterium]
MSCVIFGAGKIARGFVGHLLYLSGIEFTFVEKVDALCDLINTRGEYLVNILGAPEKNTVVKGAKALKFADRDAISEAIASADCVFTSVGGKNLPDILSFLAR